MTPRARPPSWIAPQGPDEDPGAAGGRRLAWGATPRGSEIALDPAADDVHGVALLLTRELAALGDPVPALEARPAARRAGVLGDEHRVAAVRRLLAVLVGRRRGQPLGQ